MIAIRLSESNWGKAWRAMIDVAPVRLVAGDPVFEVLPAHLELLDARGIAYEVVTGNEDGIYEVVTGNEDGIDRRVVGQMTHYHRRVRNRGLLACLVVLAIGLVMLLVS